jgi:hypothetical protein
MRALVNQKKSVFEKTNIMAAAIKPGAKALALIG